MMKPAMIIKQLEKLSENWNDHIGIFGNNGAMQVIDTRTHEILADIDGITCDGGDCNIIIRDGKEYLDLE